MPPAPTGGLRLSVASNDDLPHQACEPKAHSPVETDNGTGFGGYVAVLLDGDGCIFKPEILRRGSNGGGEAAKLLTDELRKIFTEPGLKFVVQVFCQLDGLANYLSEYQVCTRSQLKAFSRGFSAACPLYTIIDAGGGKEVTDNKLRAHLELYRGDIRFRAIVLGVTHDSSYLSVLHHLALDDKLHDIHLLKYKGAPHILRRFQEGNLSVLGRRTLVMPSLFMDTDPPPPTDSASTATSSSPTNSPMSLTTPVSEPVQAPTQIILPKGTLWFRGLVPAPCLDHYLRACNRPADTTCPFSHDYIFDDDQLVSLRSEAQAYPCAKLRGNKICDDMYCYRGHVCPIASACPPEVQCLFRKIAGTHPHGTDAFLNRIYETQKERDSLSFDAWMKRSAKALKTANSSQPQGEDCRRTCTSVNTSASVPLTLSGTRTEPKQPSKKATSYVADGALPPVRPFQRQPGKKIWLTEPRPCLAFYLNVCRQKKCKLNHNWEMSNTVISALRQGVQTIPCEKGANCSDRRCFYGHACIHGSVEDCRKGPTAKTCTFAPEQHRIGPKDSPADNTVYSALIARDQRCRSNAGDAGDPSAWLAPAAGAEVGAEASGGAKRAGSRARGGSVASVKPRGSGNGSGSGKGGDEDDDDQGSGDSSSISPMIQSTPSASAAASSAMAAPGAAGGGDAIPSRPLAWWKRILPCS